MKPWLPLRWRLVAPTLAALAGATAPAHAQDSSLARLIHRTRLENGLDVITVENDAVPLATVLVAVRNGAFTQDSADQGMAHLYEHLLFRSFGNGPDAFAIEVTRLNGAYNGATSQEVVYYHLTVPSRNVEKGIKLIARLVREAHFSNGDLKRERPIVLDELQRDESDPEQQLERHVDRMLWGASWCRKDVGGDSASLAGMTLDRLKQTYARYYLPNNAALIVTGDVSSERVFAQAGEAFRDWRPGPDPFVDHPIPPFAPRAGSTVVIVVFDVLDDPPSAFQQRLVEQGPFQSVTAYYLTQDHTGPIEIVGKTTPERAQEALNELLDEVESVDALEGVTEEELTIAKRRRAVSMAIKLEQTSLLAPDLAGWWASAGLEYYLG